MVRTGRLRFRPTLVPTVMVVAMLPVLIGLGVWQLQRLDWKADLIARIEARVAASPVAMPASIDDPAAWDYRRVRVHGRFLPRSALILLNRTHDGRPGGHLVAAFERTDTGTADGPAVGPPILIDRGWVPDTTAAVTAWPVPDGDVFVEGILRTPPPPGWFQPDNDPIAQQWYWLDLPAMADALGVAPAPPMILEAAGGDGPPPIGDQTRLALPNDHLQYALTWFGLAAVLIAIYVVYHMRRDGAGG